MIKAIVKVIPRVAIGLMLVLCLVGCAGGATLVVAASDASAASIRVADYVCNGEADEEQINAALVAGAGKIQLTDGTFTTADTVRIPSNKTLVGMGIDATILKGSGAGSHYKVIANSGPAEGNTGIHIRDLTVDGNWSEGGTTGGGAIQFTKCTDSCMIDVKVHHAYQHDVMVSRSQRIHLVRLDCYAAQGDDCIAVSDGNGVSESEYIWITDCYTHDSGTEAYQSGIEVDDGTEYVYIVGCVSENISGRDFNGHIHDGQKAIKHIYFRNCTGTGLIVYNSSATEVYEDIEVSGCTLNECSLVGPGKHVRITDNPLLGYVYISNMSEDIRVINNTISNPGDEYGGIGIHCVNVDINGVLIQGNTVSTAAQAGIFIDVCSGRTIRYLNILDNIGYPLGWQTVVMQGAGTVDLVRISGNVCRPDTGIYISPVAPSYDLTMTNWIIENNPGVQRKAGGIATIAAASTSKQTLHGVDGCGSTSINAYTASATPKETLGNATEFRCSFGNPNFNIYVDVAPGADTDFYWMADATRGATWSH